MSVVIKVENISKQYRLGLVGTSTLSDDLKRLWCRLRGMDDPFLKIGETNDRTIRGRSEYVWALRDIGFDVKQGEVVGIIGRNGAGKSTLLKILSRTTAPTTGSVKLRGRVASLLEVGTGFHPELSGRENIFLNGAILGMTRKEITNKFDEIVDFAGVERYIDTPVKRYSSGMYVRLAFAVAAHLESEILIVDEVLAVGDVEFQKKCLGKMGEVSKGEGRTVLFVSHNIQAVKNLCAYSILLANGTMQQFDHTERVIERYLQSGQVLSKGYYSNLYSEKPVYLQEAFLKKEDGTRAEMFNADENIIVELFLKKTAALRGTYLYFAVSNAEGVIIFETDSYEQGENTIDTDVIGDFISRIIIPKRGLNKGKHYLKLGIASANADNFQIESLENFISFEVIADITSRDLTRRAVTSTILDWKTTLVSGVLPIFKTVE